MTAAQQAAQQAGSATTQAASTSPAVFLEHVTKIHPGTHQGVGPVAGKVSGKVAGGVRALDDVTVAIPAGAFWAVIGASGSGKSTLLQCAAGLDVPTSGRVQLAGTDLSGMNETDRTLLRRDRVGFIFQAYNLLPALTLAENVTLPSRLAGTGLDRAWVEHLLERVGLADRLHHRPHELSGGQAQRAAIARALATRPAVLFADEPTGALDPASAAEVLNLLGQLVAETGQTVVLVTHDPHAAARAQRTLVMGGGRIVQGLVAPSAADLAELLNQNTQGSHGHQNARNVRGALRSGGREVQVERAPRVGEL